MIARHGREYAIKQLRPVGQGLEVSRPGERVEMDEWCIDLQSIIHSADLKEFFGDELLVLIGLNGETARWWLVLAIDCRTKIILGMKLTRNPLTSAAQECRLKASCLRQAPRTESLAGRHCGNGNPVPEPRGRDVFYGDESEDGRHPLGS